MTFCNAYDVGADFMEMTDMVIFKIGNYKKFLAENGFPPENGMEVTNCDGEVIGYVENSELINILNHNGISLM